MEAPEILALLVVGALAGGAAASVMGLRWPRWRRRRKSRRWVEYTVIGVLGALVGQLIFSALGIGVPGLFSGTIEVADLVVAFIGALIIIFVVDYFGW